MYAEQLPNFEHLTRFLTTVEYIATLDLRLEGTRQLHQIVSYIASHQSSDLLSRVHESLVLRMAHFER